MFIVKANGPLNGELSGEGFGKLPGDKSLSHRAALLSAMADGESNIENFQVSGVTRAMLDALAQLGVSWDLEGTALRVRGLVALAGGGSTSKEIQINCGNSATTMRLLAGAVAAWNFSALLDGSEGLRRRPMRRIVQPLKQMGVSIESSNGCAPLTLVPSELPLKALEYSMPVASAQVKSCLLLAGLAADGTTILREPGPSRDHTERMLRSMGVEVISDQLLSPDDSMSMDRQEPQPENKIYITRLSPALSQSLQPLQMRIPGDISAAAFLVVAASITPGSEIVLREVGLNPTRTGLLDALTRMGAELEISNHREVNGEPVGDLQVRYSELVGVKVSGELVVRMIDEFPVFAVAAACAHGETIVSQAEELRHKESDRISALCKELGNIGVDITERPDGFVVGGDSPVRGGLVQPHGDHRLAMSLIVAGLNAEQPVMIQGADIVSESFPGFSSVLRSLGADMGERA